LLCSLCRSLSFLFFFSDTATSDIYTLSLHDALPILARDGIVERGDHRFDEVVQMDEIAPQRRPIAVDEHRHGVAFRVAATLFRRSEEHTSELQSRENLVCRLLLEKKNK